MYHSHRLFDSSCVLTIIIPSLVTAIPGHQLMFFALPGCHSW